MEHRGRNRRCCNRRLLRFLNLFQIPLRANNTIIRVLRAAAALCENNRIALSDLPEELRSTQPTPQTDAGDEEFNVLALAERDALLRLLEDKHWNVSRVANTLGLSRNTLYRRMKRYGINPSR